MFTNSSESFGEFTFLISFSDFTGFIIGFSNRESCAEKNGFNFAVEQLSRLFYGFMSELLCVCSLYDLR
jgi:hypothetical protein